MATHTPENLPSSRELRTKRWTAVAIVCFMGLLAALPFRSAPHVPSATVASSHRERSLRFRAETPEPAPPARVAVESSRAIIPPTHSQAKTTVSQSPSDSLEPFIASTFAEPTEQQTVTDPANEPLDSDSAWRSKASTALSGVPQSCVAQKGENLMDIAERVLGNRQRWKELVELNPRYRSGFDEVGEGEEILTPGSR